jgi:hypothetical protein
VMRASAKELLEAYTEAVTNGSELQSFWRSLAVERMEALNVAVEDYERSGGADSA